MPVRIKKYFFFDQYILFAIDLIKREARRALIYKALTGFSSSGSSGARTLDTLIKSFTCHQLSRIFLCLPIPAVPFLSPYLSRVCRITLTNDDEKPCLTSTSLFPEMLSKCYRNHIRSNSGTGSSQLRTASRKRVVVGRQRLIDRIRAEPGNHI